MMEYDDKCQLDPTMPLKYPCTRYNIHLATLVIISLCPVMMSQSGDITNLGIKTSSIFYNILNVPLDVKKTKDRCFKLKAIKFCISNQNLYWRDPTGILLRFLDENEAKQVTAKMHRGMCGGNQHWKATTLKILRAGYYWPSLFSDVFSTIRAYNECHIFAGKQKLLSLPLKPIKASSSFQQWGLDFIGEINPPSSEQHN
jgi:hypothetical protein